MTTSQKDLALHQRKPSIKSKSNNWWTPLWLFISLCRMYGFVPILDVCADLPNARASNYFDKHMNALNRDWLPIGAKKKKKLRYIFGLNSLDIWCNPPNGELGKFLEKAYEQYTKFRAKGMRIMMIIPANSISSDAFWDAVELPKDRGEKIIYKPIYHRIEFLDAGKKPKFGARNAYMVVIWG